ncbi:MAG: YfiT family bacillithiol transferase [Bacteroidota bacterium]
MTSNATSQPRNAMMSDDRWKKIEQIRALPALLEQAVKGLSDEQLDTPYRDGGWTARQVVHHVADSHMNAMVRMKLILTEDHPTVKPYNQDAWAALVDSTALPVDVSLQIIRGLHSRWTKLLESVGDGDWQKSAHHPESGTLTLDRILDIYSAHGEKHVGQILGLRRARGW